MANKKLNELPLKSTCEGNETVVANDNTGKSIKINVIEMNRKFHFLNRKGRYVHMSIDDTTLIYQDIKINQNIYTSVFQNPTLSKLKELNDKYGAVFSLYSYMNNMSGLPTKFQSELSDASNWLKFGIHAQSSSAAFDETTASQATSIYNDFINKILSFTGNTNSIDRIPRLHRYVGNLESMTAMRDCACGLLGALSAENNNPDPSLSNRDSYYLNEDQKTWLALHTKLIDLTNGMIYFRTVIRTDWFASSSDWQKVYPESNGSITTLLNAWEAMQDKADNLTCLEIFGHEWSSNILTEFEKACQWAFGKSYEFAFQQEKENFGIISTYLYKGSISPLTPLPTPNLLIIDNIASWNNVENATGYRILNGSEVMDVTLDISYDLSILSDGMYNISIKAIGDNITYSDSNKSNVVQHVVGGGIIGVTTHSNGGYEVLIASSKNYLSFVKGSLSGAGGGTYPAATTTGRACSPYICLNVNGGETIKKSTIAPNNIYFGLYEYTDIPIGLNTYTVNGQKFGTWLNAPVTLQPQTKYILIGFRNNSGSVDFADELLPEMPNWIEINP